MFFQCYIENGANAVLYKVCSWMLLACATRMLCMWTLIPSKSSLPETALHRPVDLAIVGADKEGLFSLWLFQAADYNAVQAMRERTSSYLQLSMESRLGNFTTLVFLTDTRFRFPSRSRRAWTEARVE